MMPAARIADMHVCPMVTPGTPPIPHVGGPVAGPGVPTVMIAGLPAAVVGDTCVCVGPPDTIAAGSFVCLIGGKPAARVGDQTAHGGTIVMGCPTVLIGNSGGSGSPQANAMSAARATAAALVKCDCDRPATDGRIDTGTNADMVAVGSARRASNAPKLTWVEVQLRDQDGAPVAQELVRVVDADGRTREAFSDAEGIVRVSGVAPGSVRITLPALDEDLWKPA